MEKNTNPISPNYEVNTYYQLPYIDSFMSAAEWKVFTIIFNHIMICTKHDKEKTNGVEITHSWIMRKVDISERTSINAVKRLKELGVLKSRKSYAKPNKYELNWTTINSLAKRQMEGENKPNVSTSANTAKNDSCENNNNWDIMSIGEARKLWNNNN